jgi:hypothetical protein
MRPQGRSFLTPPPASFKNEDGHRTWRRKRNLGSLRNYRDRLNLHDQLRPRQVTDLYKCHRRKALLEDFLSELVELGNVAEIGWLSVVLILSNTLLNWASKLP